MQKWEYLEVVAQYPNEEGTNVTRSGKYFTLEKPWYVYLNEIGDEGWELVNVYPGDEETEIYHFKRPKG